MKDLIRLRSIITGSPKYKNFYLKSDFFGFTVVMKLFSLGLLPFLFCFLLNLNLYFELIFIYFSSGIFFNYALITLHSLVHNSLFASNYLNILFSKVISSVVFMNLKNYKKMHFEHHKNIDNEDISQFNEINRKNLFKIIFRNFFLKYLYSSIKKHCKKQNSTKDLDKMYLLNIAFTHCLIFLFLFLLFKNIFYYITLILAFLTLGNFLRELRGFCEHIIYNHKKITNSFQINLFDKILFNGNFMSFHFEHHLIPAIPSQNLENFSKKVREDFNIYENNYKSILCFFKKSNIF